MNLQWEIQRDQANEEINLNQTHLGNLKVALRLLEMKAEGGKHREKGVQWTMVEDYGALVIDVVW